uniref:ATP synthase F0 subunit 8 n=1 Tax=Pseudoglomeris montshadskii TaxID=3036343 RepID=UPI0027A12623|nr:ATP synthase F0 subunit 8 [Pseudoglomeris montshadskii]WGO57525.1 ATP synthase F0 subunit 8 [Pseudoglomeris montshadskii]
MPQMMPLSWTFLYFMFITITVVFSIMNYYLYINKPKDYTKHIYIKKLNWKW